MAGGCRSLFLADLLRDVMKGKCLCGLIEFEIMGAVPKLYQCHCSLCRKQGGSASNTGTIVEGKNFCWISGKEHISSWIKDTGFRSDFCSKCGSPVPNPLRKTSYVWIPVGLLESEQGLEIAFQIYVGSKAQWDVVSLQGVRHETMPEMSEFIAFLHGKTD